MELEGQLITKEYVITNCEKHEKQYLLWASGLKRPLPGRDRGTERKGDGPGFAAVKQDKVT